MITLSHQATFKEFTDLEGNRPIGLPHYLDSLLKDEYSPIRTFLQTVQPDVKICIQIIVQVANK